MQFTIHDDEFPPYVTNRMQFVGIDIETFGQSQSRLHRPEGRLASLQLAINNDVYMLYDEDKVPEALRRVERGIWCIHNAMFDIRQLRRWAIIKPREIWDTFLVEHAMWGGYYDTFGLNDLARRYLDLFIDKDIREDFGESTQFTEEMRQYAARDAWLTVRIAKQQAEIGVPTLYWDVDAPCIWTFLDFQPVKVDVEGWLAMVKDFDRLGREIEQNELSGTNVYSEPQVLAYLREHCNLFLKSTGAELLEEHEEDFPEIARILLARQYRKADNTYGKKWITRNVEEGDLVYTDYTITRALTGRPSSSNPNLANIPSRKIPEYRNRFISKYGAVTVLDVDQQEPRILACESHDKELMRIFHEKRDIHAEVGAAVYHVDPLTLKKGDPRRDQVGKTIGLATNYDMGYQSLARKLRIPEWQAMAFIQDYFARFRGVYFWREAQKRMAKQLGYVMTRAGRTCYINPYDGKHERNAINSPIQGGGTDLLKLWLVKAWSACQAKKIIYPVILQVYDEIVIDHHPDETEVYVPLFLDAAQEVTSKLYPEVPFSVAHATGTSWGCKH